MSKIPGGYLEWNGQQMFMVATKETVKAMKQAAIHTQGVAKNMIGKGGGKPHRPSMPGNPPRRDTGILASSVSYSVKVRGFTVKGMVGSDSDRIRGRRPGTDPMYGLWLETGTNKMAARPWLKPSLIKATPKIVSIFRKALSKL
ncbi:MAG: hypothetical protein DRP56_01210 [Planctomycetota bacterium]|nr:MAG: hypothetical protein DRP56_01210 [Planctomycetota bacterium]